MEQEMDKVLIEDLVIGFTVTMGEKSFQVTLSQIDGYTSYQKIGELIEKMKRDSEEPKKRKRGNER
jgi:hypothetical protein